MSKSMAALAVCATLAASATQATPVQLNGWEQNLQQIADSATVNGKSSISVAADQVAHTAFTIDPALDQASSTILIELAGFAGKNRFGLYDLGDTSKRLELFSGADGANAGRNFAIDADGLVYRDALDSGLVFTSSLFGFYLETPGNTWFSDPSLNPDRGEHLVAYQGQGDVMRSSSGGTAIWGSDQYMFGWEDLESSRADYDYNDFVAFVGGIKGASVPEPASMGLMALGLAGLGLFRRRRTL